MVGSPTLQAPSSQKAPDFTKSLDRSLGVAAVSAIFVIASIALGGGFLAGGPFSHNPSYKIQTAIKVLQLSSLGSCGLAFTTFVTLLYLQSREKIPNSD